MLKASSCLVVLSTVSLIADSVSGALFASENKYDASSPPPGVLSKADQQRLWSAYSHAKKCFEHTTYGKGVPLKLTVRKPAAFGETPWSSPFSAVRGAPECRTSAGNINPPKPIPVVKLDEAYGERQVDVDNAAKWFRRMASYVRYSDDPIAATLLKRALLDWSSANSLGKGIRVSWGSKPVDYSMMAAIASVLAAAAEIAPDLTPKDREAIGPWLNRLVAQTAQSHWKDRQDNKAYMRTYIVLLWGLMSGDDKAVQDAVTVYKQAIHDMRPDGSWPIDSQRSGMGLDYGAKATSHLVMMAVAMAQARGIDLFGYEVDGRSIHSAVEFVVLGMRDPATVNGKYAIACPDGGDRWGSISKPSLAYMDGGGDLVAYAQRFPDRPVSRDIMLRYRNRDAIDSEHAGGSPACQFALMGGSVNLPPLSMPAPAPELPKPKYSVETREELAHQKGQSPSVNSLLVSTIRQGKKTVGDLDFNIKGSFSIADARFTAMSLVINQPLAPGGEKIVGKLASCGARTTSYEDGKPRVIIEFDLEEASYTARNLDCIVAALPKQQAFEAKFLAGSFQDLAIGLIKSGDVDNLQHDGLKAFFRRVAYGELKIGPGP